MTYVLLLFFYHAGGTFSTSIPFSSKEKCEKAYKHFRGKTYLTGKIEGECYEM